MKIISTLTCIALVIAAATAHRMHPLSDEIIDYINSKQTLWSAGRNFHRNTSLKFIEMLTGTIRDEALSEEDPFAGKPPRYRHTNLPSHFDARNKWKQCRSLNEIRDQGACGSCWAVSTASAMTDRLCIQSDGREIVHFSALDLMSCCMFCGGTCSGGVLKAAWLYGVKKGIVSGGEYGSHEGCRPYPIPPCEHNTNNFGIMPPCGHSIPKTYCEKKCQLDFKMPYRKDQRRLSKYYVSKNMNQIMSEIYEKGPVTTSFLVYEDFLNYKSGIYRYVIGNEVGYHAVKLLGWGEENGVPYWLAANSWNTDWGDRGFFKILRGFNHLGVEDEAYAGLFRVKNYYKRY